MAKRKQQYDYNAIHDAEYFLRMRYNAPNNANVFGSGGGAGTFVETTQEENPALYQQQVDTQNAQNQNKFLNSMNENSNAMAGVMGGINNAITVLQDPNASNAQKVFGALGIGAASKIWEGDTSKVDNAIKDAQAQMQTGKNNLIQDASSVSGAMNGLKANSIMPRQRINFTPTYYNNWKELKGGKGGFWKNMGTATLQGAANGSIGGAWGAAGGAIAGLVGSVVGLFGRKTRYKKAMREANERMDYAVNAARGFNMEQDFAERAANQNLIANGINTQRTLDMANFRAYGGNLYPDGGGIDPYYPESQDPTAVNWLSDWYRQRPEQMQNTFKPTGYNNYSFTLPKPNITGEYESIEDIPSNRNVGWETRNYNNINEYNNALYHNLIDRAASPSILYRMDLPSDIKGVYSASGLYEKEKNLPLEDIDKSTKIIEFIDNFKATHNNQSPKIEDYEAAGLNPLDLTGMFTTQIETGKLPKVANTISYNMRKVPAYANPEEDYYDAETLSNRIHETNHAIQNDNLGISRSLRNIVNRNKQTAAGIVPNPYLDSPEEIHSRMMQLRYETGLKPNDIITQDFIDNNKDKIKALNLDRYTDQSLINLLNNVVDNNNINNYNNIAAFGGNLFDGGGAVNVANLFQNAVQKSAFASLYDPYTIKRGETLSGIASRNNISLEDLINANPEITNPSMINVGQQINLPVHFNNKEITDDVSDSLDTPNFLDYTVKQGDYMSKIAKSNNITLEELQKANPQIKDFNRVFVGDIIHVPQNTTITAPAPKRMSLSERRTFEEEANKTNLGAIQGYRHDNNYAVIDKKNKTITVYSPTNKVLYQSNEINTGLSGDDYNTITYTDKLGKIKNSEGNMSTPAGITEISGLGTYHSQPSYIRKRVGDETDIASSFHTGNIKKGSNGCVRMSNKTLQDLQQFLNKGTRVYTLPEKDGSKFVLKDGKLSFQADNPYGETDGSKKYWDDYNVYNDKTSGDLFIAPNENFKNKYKDTEKLGNAVKFGNTLSENKEELQKYLGLSSGVYNDLAQLAMGIADQETKFGSSTKYSFKSSMPWLVNSAKWIANNNSANSQGITQIKYDADIRNEDLKKIYDDLGITKDSLQTPEGAAKATLARLAFIYKTEVLGKRFTGADGIEVSPLDAVLYKYMGKNGELKNHTATPTLNEYIKNVNTYKNNFNYEGTFAMGGQFDTLSPNMMSMWDNKQDIDRLKAMNQPFSLGLGNSFNQKMNMFPIGGTINIDPTDYALAVTKGALDAERAKAKRNTQTVIDMLYGDQHGEANSNRYDFGGTMKNLPSDMQSYETGGTHEQNPYGGIQIGVDQQGNPNLVEQGEFRYGDYIFSDRIPVDYDTLFDFGLIASVPKKKPKKGQKKTYADYAKDLVNKTGDPNDPITKRTNDANLQRLANAEEYQKAAEQGQLALDDSLNEYKSALKNGQSPMYGSMKYNGMNGGANPMDASSLTNVSRSGTPMMAAYGGNLFAAGGRRRPNNAPIAVNRYDIAKDYPQNVLAGLIPAPRLLSDPEDPNYIDPYSRDYDGTITDANWLKRAQGFSQYNDLTTGYYDPDEIAELRNSYGLSRSGGADKDFIMALQTDLKNKGYYKGRIDGDFGPKSAAALDAMNGTNAWTPYNANAPVPTNTQFNGVLSKYNSSSTSNGRFAGNDAAQTAVEGMTNIHTTDPNSPQAPVENTGTIQPQTGQMADVTRWKFKKLPTQGKWATVGLNAIQAAADANGFTNPDFNPNFNDANRLERKGEASTFARTNAHIGGYQAPDITDIQSPLAQAIQQQQATNRALQNIGGGRNAAASIIANDYNAGQTMGDIVTKANAQNAANRMAAAEINRGIDQFNAQSDNDMYKDNLNAQIQGQQMNLNATQAANEERLRQMLYQDATNRQAHQNIVTNQNQMYNNVLNMIADQAARNEEWNLINSKHNQDFYFDPKTGGWEYKGDSGAYSRLNNALATVYPDMPMTGLSAEVQKEWNNLLQSKGGQNITNDDIRYIVDMERNAQIEQKAKREHELKLAELNRANTTEKANGGYISNKKRSRYTNFDYNAI